MSDTPPSQEPDTTAASGDGLEQPVVEAKPNVTERPDEPSWEASVDPNSETEVSEPKEKGLAVSDAERVELDGRKEFFRLRKLWSHWIVGWITALIVFNILLTFAVGLGFFDFAEYQWFVIAVTVETFLQIVGMGYIAVHFLFSNVKPTVK